MQTVGWAVSQLPPDGEAGVGVGVGLPPPLVDTKWVHLTIRRWAVASEIVPSQTSALSEFSRPPLR
jgi:hypothetical protein